jgi:phage shock protein A
MNYFSRLTDIVTCNLSEMLARESDPQTAIGKIIGEMEEGLAGARRSVATATANEERLRRELEELRGQVDQLTDEARTHLRGADESAARVALVRKQEVADVIAGLEQQHKAAHATRDHLNTMLRALEARLSEAQRRKQEFQRTSIVGATRPPAARTAVLEDDPRSRNVDDELEALKRELNRD